MSNIDISKMKALAMKVGGVEWYEAGDSVILPDGDTIACCQSSIGHMPEPIHYDDMVEYLVSVSPAKILELIAALEAAAADKQKMAGLLKRIPQTPQQAIDFIGSQYSSMEADGWEADLSTPTGDLSNVRYVLTVHDLLSAFSWNGLDDAEALSQRQEES
ncbi:hypothetical protein KTD31_17075 [Burkholderia multivorans]|uniref:hypothetical protein n=1 Tax=Burkholderia multivorans TaxID=87883 RepID=UPI001C235050|nr:hypothetical protein [Burkholderia multivorans]MBU9203072.1 hypothetical protein [Burkholderia multivorans]